MTLRALFFAYYFPPSAGPGVRRSVRFVKELPRHGVDPIVVTVRGETFRNPEEFGVDERPLREIPAGVRVERTSSWSLPRLRGLLMRTKLMRPAMMALYPLLWERQALWVLPAIRRGLALVREARPDVVYTSTGPFCSNLIGLAIRRRSGIPWVTDYRDLWTGSWIKWWPSRIHHEMERALERRCLRTADRVVANTPDARRELLRTFPGTQADRVVVIPNGWEDDGPPPAADAPETEERTVILHTGSFDDRADSASPGDPFRAWLRDRVEYRLPGYDVTTHGPRTLFLALAALSREDPRLARRLLVRLVGEVHDSWRAEAERLGIADLVEFAGSMPFVEARRQQRQADVLLMTTVSRRDGGPVPRVNAKLYEYLQAGRPILLLSDDGDAARFARAAGTGVVIPPKDTNGVLNFLRRLAEDSRGTLASRRIRTEGVEPFRSELLAGRLAETLRDAAGRRRRSRGGCSSR